MQTRPEKKGERGRSQQHHSPRTDLKRQKIAKLVSTSPPNMSVETHLHRFPTLTRPAVVKEGGEGGEAKVG